MQSSYWSIDKLPGLSTQEQANLKSCGVSTTKELLESVKNNRSLKQELADRLNLNIQYVNKWIALADLARIPSVGCEYCGVLLHSGVASVSQLTQTPVHRLHRQILRLQVATMQRQDLCPPVEEVHKWVQQARSL
jgi:Domain of unknown function (DUF4332)